MYIKEGPELNTLENITRMKSPTEPISIGALGHNGYLTVCVWEVGNCCPPDLTLEADHKKKRRALTKTDNAVILGNFNYFDIDWVNMCFSHTVEIRF